jgi:putative ABC transport system ATP-binding protein
MASAPTTSTAALSIERLRFAYPPTGRSAFELSLPSLALGRGEELLLVGRSGCGKSTLLQLISGLLDASGGSIRINGTDLTLLKGGDRDRFRGRHIGMVFQTFNLLQGFSARENVLAALLMSDVPKAEWQSRAESLLRSLGIEELRASSSSVSRAESLLRSLGIEELDARSEELSVGQQQRVAIARALACRPTLVLADEPTASLDPENAVNAIRVLRDACREQGAALLVVSHDPALESHFTRIERLPELVAAAHTGGASR